MFLGYVTNGFAYHTLEDAVRILAEIGYKSIAVTLDTHHLNPLNDDWPVHAARVRTILRDHSLRCTVETGARFLLDPRHKHQPTLVSAESTERSRRIEYLCRAIDVAVELDADSVSLWSGVAADQAPAAEQLDRLCSGLQDVLDHAERHRIPLAFEPEPGMFIDTMAKFDTLFEAVNHPLLGLTLDIGHVHCLSDGTLLDHLKRWNHVLLNVHIEDMKRGLHDHLFFGEGEVNFTEVIGLLSAIEYRGPVHVELARHSHDAVNTARRAYEFLSALWT